MWLGKGEESEGVIALPEESRCCLIDVVLLFASAARFFFSLPEMFLEILPYFQFIYDGTRRVIVNELKSSVFRFSIVYTLCDKKLSFWIGERHRFLIGY